MKKPWKHIRPTIDDLESQIMSGTYHVAKRRWIAPVVAMWLVAGLGAPSGLDGQEASMWTISSGAVEMGRGAEELFQAVLFGRLLPDGRAVVADVGGLWLRVYGPDGTRQAEMGGPGRGPGRFRAIHGLWITPEGRIGVWDPVNRRFTTFDPEGRLVDTHPVRANGELAAGNLEVLLGFFRNGDVLLASLPLKQISTDATPERWVLGRFGPGGEFRGSPGEVQGLWRAGRAPVPFSPVPWVAVHEDSIWVADGYEPKFELWTAGGDVVRTIELPWDVRPSGNPWSALEAELRRRDSRLFLELLDEAPRTDEFPPIGGLLVDHRAYHLWVKVYDPSADAIWLKRDALELSPGGEWRVLGPDGEWVATVRIPDNLIPLDIMGNRLLGVARDALDVERVVVHTVQR